jgi:hypothetical protein
MTRGSRHGDGLSQPDYCCFRRIGTRLACAFLIADRFGFAAAIYVIALLTFASSAIVAIAMRDRR